MELAVAVRTASGIPGRLRLSILHYLLKRLIHACHESSAALAVHLRLIRMDPGLCFLAMHLDRSMGPNSQASDRPGIDAINIQALTNQQEDPQPSKDNTGEEIQEDIRNQQQRIQQINEPRRYWNGASMPCTVPG
jgi:hypothetical protein